ncbi:unnamed protein product [Protopolystoma xenopodis]|uniref:Uncharacterized protein n=1 Tax=Protopolystoma xenopodis TaxID=117903 RepID=A0A3S5BKJ3_9PLAT|nr:unnamed protein product [Protopolystoma xenopodis]
MCSRRLLQRYTARLLTLAHAIRLANPTGRLADLVTQTTRRDPAVRAFRRNRLVAVRLYERHRSTVRQLSQTQEPR